MAMEALAEPTVTSPAMASRSDVPPPMSRLRVGEAPPAGASAAEPVTFIVLVNPSTMLKAAPALSVNEVMLLLPVIVAPGMTAKVAPLLTVTAAVDERVAPMPPL